MSKKRIATATTPDQIKEHFWGLYKVYAEAKEWAFEPRANRDPKDAWLYARHESRIAQYSTLILECVKTEIKPLGDDTIAATFGKFAAFVRRFFEAEIAESKAGITYLRMPR